MKETQKIRKSLESIFEKIWDFLCVYIFIPIKSLFFPHNLLETSNLKPTSAIPGPKEWPILGDALQLNKIGGPPHFLEYVAQLHKKYGDIVRVKLGHQKFVFVNNTTMYKEIAKQEPRCPATMKLPASDAFVKKHGIKRGLFFQNGEDWYNGRSLLTQLLLKDTGQFMETIFEPIPSIFQRRIDIWMAQSAENNGIISSIEQDCYELFLSGILNLTFGSIGNKILTEAGSDIKTLATLAIELNSVTFELNAYPIQIAKVLGLKCWERYDEISRYNLTIGRKCTDLALQAIKESPDGGTLEEFGLLHRMLNVCHANEEDIRIHCTDFFTDISDPVSIATYWVIIALGRHLNVQNKMLEEIVSVCGPDAQVTYKDLENLPYLSAVIKEVQRMYPTAALTLRRIEKLKINGYKISPEYIVALSTSISQRDSRYFKNAEEFNPERWLEGDGTRQSCEDAFHPFGIGKRICAGKTLVLAYLKLFAAKLVKNFIVESQNCEFELKIILYPNPNPQIKLIPRTPLIQ